MTNNRIEMAIVMRGPVSAKVRRINGGKIASETKTEIIKNNQFVTILTDLNEMLNPLTEISKASNIIVYLPYQMKAVIKSGETKSYPEVFKVWTQPKNGKARDKYWIGLNASIANAIEKIEALGGHVSFAFGRRGLDIWATAWDEVNKIYPKEKADEFRNQFKNEISEMKTAKNKELAKKLNKDVIPF